MRVISGSCRGRRLFTPKDGKIRPTADRVKESLFNILMVGFGTLSGARVLDIFAGTGNLGIEALSRGAAEAVFVDNGRESLQLVARNLELTGFVAQGRILNRDVLGALRQLATEGGRFDLVFLDPPYAQGLTEQALSELAASSLLADEAVVVAETSARERTEEQYGALRCHDRRVYGDTAIHFFKLEKGC